MTSEYDCQVRLQRTEISEHELVQKDKLTTSPSANSFQLQIELPKPTKIKVYE